MILYIIGVIYIAWYFIYITNHYENQMIEICSKMEWK